MLIDITLEITPQMLADAAGNGNQILIGHLGTHFDVMDKTFPLEYTRRRGIVWDVSGVKGRDISPEDVDLEQVSAGMFAAFSSGFLDAVGYGGAGYWGEHPQLSHELIDRLLDRGVSIIGVDFGGVRRGAEHTPKDQLCAKRGTFVVENLCNLHEVLATGDGTFLAHTYPMRCSGLTGLPCRVIAEVSPPKEDIR